MADSPTPPAAPDPTATAAAQTASNKDTARTTAVLSNPNIITPYGTQTVRWGGGGFDQGGYDTAMAKYNTDLQGYSPGGTDADGNFQPGGNAPTAPTRDQFTTAGDQATVTQALSPNQQRLLDAQEGISLQMAGIGQKGLNAIGGQLSTPLDSSNAQAATDKAYGAMTSRLDPQWRQNTNAQETQLRNQGVVPGGEAYDNAMRTFNQGKNDAYQQAQLAAMGYAPQTQQMDIAGRDALLNELNAVRTGSQVSTPQFQQYNPTSVAPTNTLGAQQMYQQGLMNTYNQQTGSNNSMMSGLMGIAGTAAGAYFGGPAGAAAGGAAGKSLGSSFSDRRLKSNVVRMGTHPLGIGIYEYDIFGRRERGVMADEVLTAKPEAVGQHPSGYLMVHYGRL